MRRRRLDLLTGVFAIASVLLLIGAVGARLTPAEARRLLARLGHTASAREVGLASRGEEREAWLQRAADGGDAAAAVRLADELLGLAVDEDDPVTERSGRVDGDAERA